MDNPFYGFLDVNVKVENGEVFVNEEMISQLCWTSEAIGSAIANYISENY